MKNFLLIIVCALYFLPAPLNAALQNTYIFDTYQPTGTPAVPFNFSSSDGYRLILDPVTNVATGLASLPASGVSSLINLELAYESHTGAVNSGEPLGALTFAEYVNSEISRINDNGFVADDLPDAQRNIDFGDDASVIFKIPTGGLNALLISEDAGLDPFRLEHCSSALITGCAAPAAWTKLFDGFSNSVITTLYSGGSQAAFGFDDSPDNIDQSFLFTFTSKTTGWFRVTETSNGDNGNFPGVENPPLSYDDGARLEIDFVGGLVTSPEPSFVVLLAAGMGGLLFAARRKKAG